MCTLMAAIGAAGSLVQFVGQAQATNAYNEQARAAHQQARVAATRQYGSSQSNYVYNVKDVKQKGYKLAIDARKAKSTALASAGSAGINPGSMTVDALLADIDQRAANNEANIRNQSENLRDKNVAEMQQAEATAAQRIANMPEKQGPNPLALFVNLASSAAGGYTGNPGFFGIKMPAQTTVNPFSMY